MKLAIAATLAAAVLLGACTDEQKRPEYNLPPIGAPALGYGTPTTLPIDGGAFGQIIEDQLPEEASKNFRTLGQMDRSPRWAPFARVIRNVVRDVYRRAGGRTPRPPHDVSVTQYFIRKWPEIYGVDFVAWCGGDFVGALGYVENHLLLARRHGRLEVLVVHQPSCGSVGDRTVSFIDLVGDGTDELVETYVEDTAVGDDFQEVRVFHLGKEGLRRVAEIREVSPVKFFHVEFRRTEGKTQDIVTTRIELEKALGKLRQRPCWVYRYFEVETVHRYEGKARQFVPAGASRRRLAPNVALDLTGGEVPVGSCEG